MLRQRCYFAKQHFFADRQRNYCCFRTTDSYLASGNAGFAANVAESDGLVSMRSGNGRCAGDLTDFFFAGDDFRALPDLCASIGDKSGKPAVNCTTRTDPLDNFLADVAAFVEIQGT